MDQKNSLDALDVLAFSLEMAALALWGLWAWTLPRSTPGRLALTALVVAAFIALWALFFSPRATWRLSMPWLLIGKALLLLPPGLLRWWGRPLLALVWAAAVLAHLGLATRQGRL